VEPRDRRPVLATPLACGVLFGGALALWEISAGRMARGVAVYTVSGLLLLLAMGLFVPELSLLFAFATFIFLAFGLSYMTGRASMQVVVLTLVVALVLLVTADGLGWTSGVPDNVFRWINLVGMLMALSIDATMFAMLRRTPEGRANRLVEAERAASAMLQRISQQERLESLGKLAGGVAHDFNNLLAIILNYSSFVAEAVEDRPAALVDTREIQHAAQPCVLRFASSSCPGFRETCGSEAISIPSFHLSRSRLRLKICFTRSQRCWVRNRTFHEVGRVLTSASRGTVVRPKVVGVGGICGGTRWLEINGR
jgi:signal transduction histidine kinase